LANPPPPQPFLSPMCLYCKQTEVLSLEGMDKSLVALIIPSSQGWWSLSLSLYSPLADQVDFCWTQNDTFHWFQLTLASPIKFKVCFITSMTKHFKNCKLKCQRCIYAMLGNVKLACLFNCRQIRLKKKWQFFGRWGLKDSGKAGLIHQGE
jgi:hypothetical protein